MRIKWRGLELPSRVQADRASLTDTYGKFHAEPFERSILLEFIRMTNYYHS